MSKKKKISIVLTAITMLFIVISLIFYGLTRQSHCENRFENVASMSIQAYQELQGTSQNAIRRGTSVTNDLVAMNLDPNLFVRFAIRPANRPDLRIVALGEYHFHRDGVHQFRKFIYLHIPFTFDNSIVNEHLRFQLTFITGPHDQQFVFDTRADENAPNPNTAFGYGMNFIKSNRARGLWVLELQRDFNVGMGNRETRIYSIDRMNRTGTLISRNDQTTYMGGGTRLPFIATYDDIEDDQYQIEFEFNSHVFITENMVVEVAPDRVPEREGQMWVQGNPSGWGMFRDIYYRPQLWFFNFNTTVDIDKIHNIRIYFQYRTRYEQQTLGGLGGGTVTYTEWEYGRDSSGNIGRTIQNQETGLHFLPSSDVRFNAITTPANARFAANEFVDFNINRAHFDNFEHSVLFHQAYARDERRPVGNNNNIRGQVDTQSIDVTTMDFETNGQMFRARVDITQDTEQGGYTPEGEHPGGGIGDVIGRIGGGLASIWGSLFRSVFGGFFRGLGWFGTLVFLAIVILVVRFFLMKFNLISPRRNNQTITILTPSQSSPTQPKTVNPKAVKTTEPKVKATKPKEIKTKEPKIITTKTKVLNTEKVSPKNKIQTKKNVEPIKKVQSKNKDANIVKKTGGKK